MQTFVGLTGGPDRRLAVDSAAMVVGRAASAGGVGQDSPGTTASRRVANHVSAPTTSRKMPMTPTLPALAAVEDLRR